MTTDHKKPKSRALCCEKTWPKGMTGSWPCANPAKVIRDGKPYCGVHDPVKVKARREKRYLEWKETAAAKDAALVRAASLAEAASAERDRRADCFDDLLDALEKLAPHIPDAVTACHGNKCRQPFCEDCSGEDEAQKAIEAALEAHLQAIAAIAKARGA